MVRVVEGDETLWMPGGEKDLRRVVDPDRRVARSVENNECAVKRRDRRRELLCRDVLEEFAADLELAPRELDFGLAVDVDLGALSCEEFFDVRGIGRGIDRRDRDRFRDLSRSREHCRAAEAVPDENRRRGVLASEPRRGRDEIRDVG